MNNKICLLRTLKMLPIFFIVFDSCYLFGISPSTTDIKNNKVYTSEGCRTSYKISVVPQYSRVCQSAKQMPKEKGNVYGIDMEFECQKKNDLYVDLLALFNYGRLNGSIPAHIKEIVGKGAFGYSFFWGCYEHQWVLSSYAGFGYRLLVNHFLESVPPWSSMRIHYHNYFIPIGFKLQHNFSCNWKIGFNGLFMPSVTQMLYVCRVKGTLWKQSRSPSYEVEVPVTWINSYSKYKIEISLVPFYKHWVLGSSKVLSFPTWRQNYWGIGLQYSHNF